VLVPGARRLAATAAGADETKDRMVVRKRRDRCDPATTCTGLDRRGWNESPSTSPNARKVATLNQSPDGRPRHAKRSTRFVDGHHLNGHTQSYHDHLIVSIGSGVKRQGLVGASEDDQGIEDGKQ
jgi:hypothetical protein